MGLETLGGEVHEGGVLVDKVNLGLGHGNLFLGGFLDQVAFSLELGVERAQADNQGRAGEHAFHAARFARRADVDDLRRVVNSVFVLDALIVKGKVQGAVGEFLYKEIAARVGFDGLDVAVGVLVGDDRLAQALAVLGIDDGARESPLGVLAVYGIGDGTSGKIEGRGRYKGG